MNTTNERVDDPFVMKLTRLQNDRGSLSHLRRFWSETTLHYAYPVLGRLGVADRKHPDAFTAALFAVHPEHRLGGPSIGKAALFLGERKEEKHPYDMHFRRLLASETLAEAALQLHKLVRRLERENIALDYNAVMWDLRNWHKKAPDIKAHWAMDFWQAPAELVPGEQP
jgi:CRISPR system Cascade subunit CasB